MSVSNAVRIKWEGPLSLDVVGAKSREDDYGLYQIYARHVVFGLGSLVYIGKAEIQTFSARFAQHLEDWLREENEVSIHLGRLAEEDYLKDDNWLEWGQLLSDAEKLSIFTHSPPYNSHHITQYTGRPDLHIQNWGNRGSLLPEYSTVWRPLRRPDDSLPE